MTDEQTVPEGVEIKSDTAECENAYGKKIDKFKFDFSYKQYITFAALKAADKVPSNDEILKFVNRNLKASARSTEQTKQLTAKGYKKPDLNDPEYRYEKFVEMLILEGNDEAEAREMAKMLRKK